jgi:hypothetical protein
MLLSQYKLLLNTHALQQPGRCISQVIQVTDHPSRPPPHDKHQSKLMRGARACCATLSANMAHLLNAPPLQSSTPD